MQQKIFEKGFSRLMAVTSRAWEMDQLDTFKELLNDLDEDDFLKAIDSICKEQISFYQNTNPVALIRTKVKTALEEGDTKWDASNREWQIVRNGEWVRDTSRVVL